MKMKILMPNFYEVSFGIVTVWFSFVTPIAFRYEIEEVVISENIWTRTTGKHINYIKQNYAYIQVDNDEFNDRIGYLSN